MQKTLFVLSMTLIVLTGCRFAEAPAATPTPTDTPTPVPTDTPIPTPTPSITVEDLTGIWIKGCTYLQFKENGTYHTGHRIDRLEDYPEEVGTFQLDGTSLMLITGEVSLFCSAGQTGIFGVELTQQGEIKLVAPEDECLMRGTGWSAGSWAWVSPAAAPVSPTLAATESTVTFPVTVTEDAVYAIALQPDASPPEWRLDVYAPTEAGTWPVVVFVHGASERKVTGVGWGRAIAEQGAVVFIVDWPVWIPDEAVRENGKGFRDMSETLACAIRFARATASDYGGNPAQVTLVGFSAGGGAGSAIALAGDDLDRLWEEFASIRGGPPSQVECVMGGVLAHVDAFVGISGPYGALEFLQEKDLELWEIFSPYAHVGENPDLQVRLIHGKQDYDVRFESSVQFHEALAEAGYDTELIPHDGYHEIPTGLTVETVMEVARD